MEDAARTPLDSRIGHGVVDGCKHETRMVGIAPFGKAAALALLAGTMAGLWLPTFMAAGYLFAIAPVAGIAWWRGRRGRWMGPLLGGFVLAGLHGANALAIQLPPALEGGDFEVSGRIVDLPDHQARRTSYLFRIAQDHSQPEPLRGRLVRLSWYDDFDGSPTGRDRLRAGQDWTQQVRLKAPRGLRNPGGADSEKHALARRLVANGYVREPGAALLRRGPSGLHAWRESMADRISMSIPSESGRFIRALALGDTRLLADEDWRTLRATGLVHLVAISGFHVGLVSGFFALFAGGIWWVLPSLARRLPRPTAAAVAALLGAAGYAAIAGFALPTVRTVLMIAVIAGLRIFRRRAGAFDSMALAAIALLLADPLSVLGAGFWLSFAGVAWLVWCLPDAGRNPLRDLFSAQGVATLGLLPLSAMLFGEASIAGPLTNLLAVPWWSLVVVPLSLLGTALEVMQAGLGGWAWRAAAWCFEPSWSLFERVAQSPFSLLWLPEPRWFALPLALLGAFWLLLPRGLPGRPLAVLLWLPLLWPARNLPAPGEFELQVLDVGQGLSVLVRTSNRTLLYDAGPAAAEGFDAGERVVVPSLRALGVRQLDRVVVSHGDNDHAGGFAAVRATFPAERVIAPQGAGIDGSTTCVGGEEWAWDGVRFRFLHPPKYFPYLGNEASCVLRIEGNHGSVLLTGDIGDVVERDLVRRSREDPAATVAADVALIAHHGSGGSSDPSFVEATAAEMALVSSGHGNRFGHPREDVVERWRSHGAQVSGTAEGGALVVHMGAEGPRLETRRASHPRAWDAARRLEQAAAGPPAGLSYRPD